MSDHKNEEMLAQQIAELEAKLQQQEFIFNRAQKLAQMGWWQFEVASQTRTWTETLFQLFDCDPALGEPDIDTLTTIIHPDDRTHHNTLLKQAQETGESFQIDFRVIHKNGSIRHLQTHGEVECNAQGNPIRLQGIVLDLTKEKEMEEDLTESSALYQHIANFIADALVFVDQETGQIIEVNEISCQLYGYQRTELLKLKITDISAEPKKTDKVIKAVTDGVTRVALRYHKKKDGTIFPSEIRATIIFLKGRPTIVETVRDMTDWLATQEKLYEREKQYRLLFDTMLSGFALHEIILDDNNQPCDYRFLEVNPAFEQITGKIADLVIGKQVLEIWPQTEDYWIEIYGQVALTGEPIQFEKYTQALNKHFEVFAFSPQLNQFATIFTDITSRKQIDETIRTNEKQLDAILEGMYQLITLLNPDGTILHVNSATCQAVGLAKEELIGLLFDEGEWWKLSETAHTQLKQALHDAAQGNFIRYEVEIQTTTDIITLDFSLNPIKNEYGEITLIVAEGRNITEQKFAEAERERLQQAIIEAQQSAIAELSVPIIPLMNQIIIMPLVGNIDSVRAKDLMRALLQGISTHRAKIVILDITGVSVVDTSVANHLDKTIQAARLKGARTIITGISDSIAETIIDLGIDWRNIETLRDLQTGLLVALDNLGIKLHHTASDKVI